MKKELEEACCDYRYKETIFRRKNGAIVKQIELIPLKSTGGFDFVGEEFSMMGSDMTFPVPIGKYKPKNGDRVTTNTINETKDWETGYVDSYDIGFSISAQEKYPTIKHEQN